MDAVQCNAFRRGMGGLGEGLAPGQMPIVAQPAPVYRTQDHGGARSKKDNAESEERIIDAAHRLDQTAAQRVAQGRGDVTAKGGQVQGRHDDLMIVPGRLLAFWTIRVNLAIVDREAERTRLQPSRASGSAGASPSLETWGRGAVSE